MNKLILLLFGFFTLNCFYGFSQEPLCLPDSTYANSLAGVYPGPYHAELFPEGGIKDTACINHAFELTFTAVVQDSITFQGLNLKLNHLKIMENGILNLPEGLTYGCNPPNCTFEANTLGCLFISGIPLESNETGPYDLKLKSEIVALNGLITVTDTLPQFLIPDSHYFLMLDSEDSAYCQGLNANDINYYGIQFEVLENPVDNEIRVKVKMDTEKDWVIEVIDFNGKKVARKVGKGNRNIEVINLNEPMLHSTYLIVRLITDEAIVAKKIIAL